jgi:class 3 adenylate cyclase/tetratricopeptide (TPR) repeat protein
MNTHGRRYRSHIPFVIENDTGPEVGLACAIGPEGGLRSPRQAISVLAYPGAFWREVSLTIENVAVLFTDIVGSTELSQRLSPDAADELRRGHFSILRQAIAESGGTEVKNMGDGLMVVFASASAALACGVTMQQGVERDNRDREHSVGLRVGLSGGEVTREDDDYFGDPVVEAARLCATCESGQVLATDILRGMAGRRNRHECRSVGGLTLKGLPDPIATVEVLWEPLGGAETGISIPLSGRLALPSPVGVVGRDAEIQTITDAVKRVANGEGREVLLVSGEAGLGKTTLVAEAARAAFDTGACVLFGHCEEDLATPYQLFAEALGHYVTHAPEEQLLAHVETHGSELSRLVPTLASRIRDLPPSKATDSDTERFLLFAAVVGLLGTMSQEQPVVLVLDDLQWADKGSLLLLRHLAAAEHAMRVLILGTYRDSELSQTHPLTDTLAALHRQRGVSRIELAGLDDSGVVALLEAAAGQSLDAAGVGLAHAVYRETDGNPFFVSEVLRHLSETGAIYQDATGRWVAESTLEQLALPDSVRVVIGARVGRLGKDAGRVLSVASVIGRDFDLDLLTRATKTSEDDLLDILDSAASVALVREVADTGRYSFSHALIQHTLYEDLGHNRRARSHRQVAEALEELCGDRPGARVGELARHWVAATQPIDLNRAIDYSRQAGDAALEALAPAEALRYYAQALALYPQVADPDPVLGIDLAIGLGTAQRQTGDPASRETLLTAARQAADLGDAKRLVAAALANDRGYITNNNATDTDKVGVLEMAADRLSADDPDRALVLATLCSELCYGSTLERRKALATEAMVIAASSGNDATIARVVNSVLFPLLVPSMLEQQLSWTEDAMVRAERVGDPVLLFLVAHSRATAVFLAGDIDEMDRCIETMCALAEQLDQPIVSWTNTFHLAKRAQIAGDTDLAEQLATEALQIGTDCGQPDAALFFGGSLSTVSLQRGTMGELIPLFEQMLDETSTLAGLLTAALAQAHAEADHTEDVRHLLEEFAAADFDLPMDQAWITAMYSYAAAAIHCGDPKYAGPLFDRLAPWVEQSVASGSVMASGLVSHSLGGLATVLRRYDEADAYFDRSAAMSARMNAKFFLAMTDLLWGTMLAERKAEGDTERARHLLTKAQGAAAAHGYGKVERRAAAALQLLDP